MSGEEFLPIPTDRVIEIHNKVADLWNQTNSNAEFKRRLIEEFHVDGTNAYWFVAGMVAGILMEDQHITDCMTG